MAAAVPCAAPQSLRYQRRRPEQTLWYRIVQAHFATLLELASGPCGGSPPAVPVWAAGGDGGAIREVFEAFPR